MGRREYVLVNTCLAQLLYIQKPTNTAAITTPTMTPVVVALELPLPPPPLPAAPPVGPLLVLRKGELAKITEAGLKVVVSEFAGMLSAEEICALTTVKMALVGPSAVSESCILSALASDGVLPLCGVKGVRSRAERH